VCPREAGWANQILTFSTIKGLFSKSNFGSASRSMAASKWHSRRIDLYCGTPAAAALGVDDCGDITVDHSDTQLPSQSPDSLFNKRCLSCAWGGHEIERKYSIRVQSSAVFFRQAFIGT
jgi:hypothetical protein